MTSGKCAAATISVLNTLLIILAVIICCLSLNDWNDYALCSLTILTALSWTCCLCARSNIPYAVYAAVLVTNALLILANAIYHTIMNVKYSDYCFNGNQNSPSPAWGCEDWREGHHARSVGIIVCYFISFILEIANISCACLRARDFYNDGAGY